ncbi:hypothetical protein Francci3_3853 [Frankia casuarinae]|uniref:Uncharacterized protein n=1 Tax=Frankia casuarinae (strain DSM 45818 / CECT 9043 / HFP020203 / CcI3) TaxID=106370 RepID=Q2J689_FRACC|nr:hypothetical protein Francci3_3853 [Frankia casuarinae]
MLSYRSLTGSGWQAARVLAWGRTGQAKVIIFGKHPGTRGPKYSPKAPANRPGRIPFGILPGENPDDTQDRESRQSTATT